MDASTNENGSSRILSNSGCNETTAVYPNTLIDETVVEGYAIFTCDIGFEMDLPDHGDAVLAVCNGTSGEWEFIDQSPKCEMISCLSPPLPAYGYFEEASLGFGESGNYTCEQEFIVDGEATATCQADGTWSSEPPRCRVSCPTSEDSLANAYLSDTQCVGVRSDSKTWNEANETCVVQGGSLVVIPTNRTLEIIQGVLRNVSDGYTAGYWIGGYEAPKNSSWKWDKNSTCASVSLSILDDGVFQYDGKCYFFQNVGFFKWADANSVDGDAGNPGCLDIGDRSGFLAEIRDEDTQNVLKQFGVRSYWIGAVLEESSSGRSWLWVDGSSISSSWWGPEEPSDSNENCIDLYPFPDGGYLMNDEACSNVLRYVCEFSVTNSTTVCGDPGTPYRGYRPDEISAPFLTGESIEFSCDEGYELAGASKVVCQPDGTWNETIPTCDAIECGPAPSVHNASISHLTSSTYRGTAVYSCNEGYELVGNPSVYCMSNGDWSAADFTCQGSSNY
nr:sushi, von Willebrand factor type A, EGF and pentraxin domain-containing protein 1-like [Lytechinus pictus]